MSPNKIKQNLIRCKCDIETFGDLKNTFCNIKANVKAGLNVHVLAGVHIACFKDMSRYMVSSWFSEDLIKNLRVVM